MRPKLLDLFCGAGGAALGYHNAGYWVIGVDIQPQPHYPFKFYQADAIEALQEWDLEGFSIIHASPPCQAYTKLKSIRGRSHPDLVGITRELLKSSQLPYIIENVPGAPLIDPLRLCGTQFSLGAWCRDGRFRQLRRHRLFESNLQLQPPVKRCHHLRRPIGVYGNGGGGDRGYRTAYMGTSEEAVQAMGIYGMTLPELAQAIPPAYTEFLGRQVRAQI